MSDWPLVTLKDITSVLGDGLHGTPEYDEEGEYHFINGNNLKDGKIVINEKTKRASLEQYEKHKKPLNDRTLLVSINGTIGNVAEYNGERIFLGKSACYFNVNEDVDKHFVKYVVSSPVFKSYLDRLASGSTIKNVSLKLMREFSFHLPPLEIQNSISDILKSLDDKISNNTVMDATLEKIAQRIFKSWFVDFDPVKANAEGVPFDGLSPEIQALFPNEFEESELGVIPKGWEVKSLDEIAHFLNGLACQKHRPKEGEAPLPVIKIAEMRAGYQEKTNEASPSVDPKYIVNDGDFLFSWSGSLTTCFWSHGPGVLNQHLFKVTSEDYPKWFYSMWVNRHLAEFIRIAADKATTMGHIKREHLSQAKVVVPNLEELISKGNDIFGPLIERSNLCLTQAKTLMKVRDKLLPRLISGKITIQKAEELLEEAS